MTKTPTGSGPATIRIDTAGGAPRSPAPRLPARWSLPTLLAISAGLAAVDFWLEVPAWPGFVLLGVVAGVFTHRLARQLIEAQEVRNYRLEKMLGKGGMGEVWLAKHRMLPRPAVIKFIRPESIASGGETANQAVRRFEQEARTTAMLTSPNTIEIYDFGLTEDGALCYVMEYLEGMDLESLVREFGPLSPGRVIYLLRQVCISLAEAHQHPFIHRDIKPANIYVCRKGLHHDFVKVLDFGMVADKTAWTREDTRITVEGKVGGTPGFMAPEVAAGKDFDARTDIYSLGCVAYWLLTGQAVFEGESVAVIVSHHLHSKPEPPSARAPQNVPSSLDQVVLACLEKDPARRVQSAIDLTRRLAECTDVDAWSPGRAMEWWQRVSPGSRSPEGTETVREVDAPGRPAKADPAVPRTGRAVRTR